MLQGVAASAALAEPAAAASLPAAAASLPATARAAAAPTLSPSTM